MRMTPFLASIVNSAAWSLIVRKAGLSPLKRHVASDATLRVLELGCGRGDTSRELAEWLPNARIEATDVDSRQIGRAESRNAFERIRFSVADAQCLPYPDASFDLVAEFDAFHHLEEWRTGIREACRVLRPGGMLVLMDVTERLFRNPLVRALDRPSCTFSDEELRAALRGEGLLAEADETRAWLHRSVHRKPK